MPLSALLRQPLRNMLAMLPLSGCAGLQSALDPAGPRAENIAQLWWLMFWAGCAILTLVLSLALYTLRPRRVHRRLNANRMIIGGGIVLPVVALTGLLLFGYRIGALHEAAVETRVSVEVTGQQFWWRIRYPDGEAETAGELRIPTGEPVEVRLRSMDVIHSFWVPRLAGKLDVIPGRENRLWLQADRPGVFRGQCAEFCGSQHALMSLVVVAQPPDEFEAWLTAQEAPASTSGNEIFAEAGCQGCHRIRGTEAGGGFGPDLTHIGSRWRQSALHAPGKVDTLAGWILTRHRSLPLTQAAGLREVDESTLAELAAYLETLQ